MDKDSALSRVGWIDAAKGIAILMVIWGHVSQGNVVVRWFGSFHVALFLGVSGFLIGEKSQVRQKRSTIKRNLIPYFWFSIAAILVKCVYCVVCAPEEMIMSFSSYFYRTVVGYGILALWFIPSYLIGQHVFFFIRKRQKAWQKIILILMLPVAAVVAEHILMLCKAGLPTVAYKIIYYPTAAIFRGSACAFYIYIGYKLNSVFKKYGKEIGGGGIYRHFSSHSVCVIPTVKITCRK